MLPIKILTVIALVSELTACSASTALVAPSDHPRIVDPDSALTQDCKLPTNLPLTALTQRQIEAYWSTDRLSLVDCGKRHAALRDFIAQRDHALVGK